VLGIQEREQEADGDRLDPGVLQLRHLLVGLRLVERDEDGSVARDPLGHRQPVAAAHDRVALPREILVVGEVERLLVPRDMEDVAVALGGDQPDLRAVVLDHDVGRDRRAVEDLVQVGRRGAGVCGQLPDSGHRALRGVLRRRRELVDEDLAGFVVDVDQVGERTADIDSQSLHRTP
jgi:hypothetical protein